MKRIANVLTFVFATALAFGATRGLTIDENEKIINSPNFATQNNLVSNEVICVRVDMFRGGSDDTLARLAYYWSDAELKVLDKDGKLLYFATTSYNDVRSYHSSDGTWDSKCAVYYYIAGTKYAYAGQCSNPKRKHEVNASQTLSIGAFEKLNEAVEIEVNHPITAIEFFPNLDGKINGKSIRDIFLNPENTIIVSRKNQTELERTGNGDRVWRPTIPQYYRR